MDTYYVVYFMKDNFDYKRIQSIPNQILFLKNLEKSCKSGLPGGRFFHMLAGNTKNIEYKNIYRQMAKDIENGSTITDSLKKHPQILDSLSLALINVGEKSGKLAEVAENLVQGKTKLLDFKKKVTSDLRKPFFEFLGAILIFLITFFGIIGGLNKFYTDISENLPPFLGFISNFQQVITSPNTVFIVIFLASMAVIYDYVELELKNFKEYINYRILTIPFIGNIIKNFNLSYYFLTLKTCYVAGLSTVESMQLAGSTIQQPYLKTVTGAICEDSKSGEPINRILAKHEKVIGSGVIQLIEVGEETGRLDESYNDAFLLMQEDIESDISKLCLIAVILNKIIVFAAVVFVFANVASVIVNSLSNIPTINF